MIALRVLGGLLALGGLVLSFAPNLASDPAPALDTFATIERRVPWGGLAGLGAFFIARTKLKPWGITIASFIFWVTIGFLVARGIGLALDGIDSGKQWMWFGIEVAVIAGAGLYVWRKRSGATAEA